MGGVSGYQQGPLRTGELLIFPKGWEAPSFCLPSSTPLPPSFTFLGICRAQMGTPGILRAPAPAGWCKQAQSEMGGRGRVVRGVGAPPRGRRRLGQPLRRPLLLPGQKSPCPRPCSSVLQAPEGGVHTELLRFMRLRKVDRLCRPVDTELMAERCAPLQRQRCEGVSL